MFLLNKDAEICSEGKDCGLRRTGTERQDKAGDVSLAEGYSEGGSDAVPFNIKRKLAASALSLGGH